MCVIEACHSKNHSLTVCVQAVDRDAFSGWGAVVYVIENDKVTKRTLKARMD